MKFHDEIAYNDILNEAYPPTEGIDEFSYLIGMVDAAIGITKKLEAIPFPKRGVVTQVMK